MTPIKSEELIKEFYKSLVKPNYPDISFEQCKEICHGPWVFLKDSIRSGLLPTIRLKYFGTFVVYPKRVLMVFERYRKKFKEQKITPELFHKKRKTVNKYLENADNLK